jgi:hypothetical protein
VGAKVAFYFDFYNKSVSYFSVVVEDGLIGGHFGVVELYGRVVQLGMLLA